MRTIQDYIEIVVERVRNSPKIQPVKDYLDSLGLNSTGIPFFMAGHPQELNIRLLEKEKDSVFKYQRYPVIILRLDAEEPIIKKVKNFNLNIGILHYTDKNYTREQRDEFVFKPILLPLYVEFIKQLKASRIFMWPGNLNIPDHRPINRYYWGTQGSENTGNVKNIFTDPIDAVEIVNLKINRGITRCDRIFSDEFSGVFG